MYGAGLNLKAFLFEFEFAFTNFKATHNTKVQKFTDLVSFVIDDTKEGKQVAVGDKEHIIRGRDALYNLSDAECKKSLVLITAGRYAEQISKSLAHDSLIPKNLNYVVANNICFDSKKYPQRKLLKFLFKSWSSEYTLEDVPNLVKKLDSWLLDDRAIIPFVSLGISNKCNLNCRDCIGYMPHLKERGLLKDVDIDTVLKDIEILNKNSVYIGTITLSTGETFIYPHLDKVLEAVVYNEKIHNVMLVTNGTAIPKPELVPLLRNKKVSVHISDYGDLMSTARAVDFYEKNDIRFFLMSGLQWKRVMYPKRKNLSVDALRKIFSSCGVANSCPCLITEGKMFACGMTKIFCQLDEYDGKKDYFEASGLDSEDFKFKFYEMLETDYLESCDVCGLVAGMNEDKFIDAGIQADSDKQWRRSSYMLVKRNDSVD